MLIWQVSTLQYTLLHISRHNHSCQLICTCTSTFLHVNTYCHTTIVDEKTGEEHYASLKRTIESVPAHNLLLVIGDFNATVWNQDT